MRKTFLGRGYQTEQGIKADTNEIIAVDEIVGGEGAHPLFERRRGHIVGICKMTRDKNMA